MTRVEAAELVAVLAAAFPEGIAALGPDDQERTLETYARYMEDIPFAAGDGAVRRLIVTFVPTSARRWPSIAEVRREAALVQHGRPPTGIEAWGALRRLTGWSPMSRLEAMDPVMYRCLDSLGWLVYSPDPPAPPRRWRVSIGNGSEGGAVADRARFADTYTELAERAQEDAAVGSAAPVLPAGATRLLPRGGR